MLRHKPLTLAELINRCRDRGIELRFHEKAGYSYIQAADGGPVLPLPTYTHLTSYVYQDVLEWVENRTGISLLDLGGDPRPDDP
jgi:hypothetical protein